MAATDNFAVRVLNDIVHDAAAAVAMAAPYASLALLAATPPTGTGAPGLAPAAWRLVGYAVVAVIVLLITGAVRLRYAQAVIEPDARPARSRSAVIKHGAFVLILIGGIAVTFMVASKLA